MKKLATHPFSDLFRFLAGVSFAAALPVSTALAQPSVSEQEAYAIGVNAYLYFYPIVTMDITRKQLSNIEPGKGFGGPMNTFVNLSEYPPADLKTVVRPNFDTLYSSAWLDLTKEPMIVSVPDTSGRYYLLPMLDMWTDVFASPGWRTTGTGAGDFIMVPPGWRPDLRDRLIEKFNLPKETQRIDAPTPFVWIIGRTKTDGPQDYEAVHKIQAGYKITPLSQCGPIRWAFMATTTSNAPLSRNLGSVRTYPKMRFTRRTSVTSLANRLMARTSIQSTLIKVLSLQWALFGRLPFTTRKAFRSLTAYTVSRSAAGCH